MTDMIPAYGGRKHLTDWQVEVNHAIKETGRRLNTDAVLARPTKTSEVRLFALDNGTMPQARLARRSGTTSATPGTASGKAPAARSVRRTRSGSDTATPAPRPSRGCTSP
ncbi:hypothetical protein [Streptomyces coeruleorubidus]|uniref:hypothetical protein n=1 Tax=Streptomyces coeruleorubidus TaxID=116188 RepID=UPI0036C82FBE